jgi:hypothetical protein
LAGLSEEDRAAMATLEAEIAGLAEETKACDLEIRRTKERELAGEGTFAPDIFRLQQRKMVLATEIQHRKVRINALRWGI